jgi:tRNA pseudouridine55 synthase
LTEEQAVDLGNGKRIELPDAVGIQAALAPSGRLIGLLEVVDGRARVLVNFPPDLPITSEVSA